MGDVKTSIGGLTLALQDSSMSRRTFGGILFCLVAAPHANDGLRRMNSAAVGRGCVLTVPLVCLSDEVYRPSQGSCRPRRVTEFVIGSCSVFLADEPACTRL